MSGGVLKGLSRKNIHQFIEVQGVPYAWPVIEKRRWLAAWTVTRMVKHWAVELASPPPENRSRAGAIPAQPNTR